MALVKYGGGITQMSGSIAGNTHARNRYGNYIRARTKPVNPNTDRQVEVRAAMANLVERWAETITAAARTAWNLYASNVAMKNRLGETINLSGFNHYIRSNLIRITNGIPVKDNGPVIFTLPDQDPTLAFTGSAATQQFSIVYDDTLAWDNETDGALIVFEGRPQNPQRNFFNGPWRYVGQVAGVTGAPVASPLAADSVFGIAEGQRQWIYARISRADGRLSNTFRADAVIGA